MKHAVKQIHFVGVGGAGMSGIAEILHNLGYRVTGSDQSASATTDRLGALGLKIDIGHDAANIGYAAGLGFSNIGGIAFTFTPDIVARGTDGVWYGADVLGTNPGGFYAFDATQNTIGPGAENFGATPGVKNTVPAPGAMALLSLGGLMVARRRRA